MIASNTKGTPSHSMTHSRKGTLVAALTVTLICLLLGVATSADPARERLDRKVKVMERVLDEVLKQSENVTVGMSRSCRGLVLDDYGVVFTLDASLGVGILHVRGMTIEQLREGAELEALINDGEEFKEARRNRREDYEKQLQEQEENRKQHLAAFKQELSDALIDYGVTLSELDNDEWVVIAAFFDGFAGPFTGNEGGRLVLKIRMEQLRKHAAGSLSRQAVSKAIIVEQTS